MSSNEKPLLLEVEDIKVEFPLKEGTIRAVNGVSLSVRRGATIGIVGESGCGKSVMARSILRIVAPPGEITNGKITYHRPVDRRSTASEPIDLTALDPAGKDIRRIRGAEIAMIFQEPMTSLSPVHTIGNQIGESIQLHQGLSAKEAQISALEMLRLVGMPQPQNVLKSYPYQISGGMRQRAMIAMALSCHPNLLIADEPTTALDVTTQAQILTLMRQLQAEIGMATLFITHDLGVVAQMTEFVVVMYLGKVVESADVDSIFYRPLHPYTSALINSIPKLGQKEQIGRLTAIKGSVPDPYSIPKGCPFHTRCPFNDGDRCIKEVPVLREVESGHMAACHYAESLDLASIETSTVQE
ncbi:MAG: dipeptide/oligopeptide/nickel ABC transporter ATP-binding protein [Anaerolineaceae bacterium]|nr:dipeptide/oligopeptide/nickel ABC transporter ATP-binding protein [Anaerolineaceae bacterium]